MKIKYLNIFGYRGLKDKVSIDFSNQTTAIIGANGSGKTTIINAIVVLFESMFVKLLGEEINPFDRIDVKRDISIGLTSENAQVSLILNWGDNNGLIQFEIFKKGATVISTDAKLQSFEMSTKDYIQYKVKHNQNIPIPIFYPTDRGVEVTQLKRKKTGLTNYEQAFEDAFSSKANFKTFFEWFKEREDYENEMRLNENNDFRLKELKAVRTAITQFLSNFGQLRVKRHPKAEMVIKKGETELSLNQLSHGERIVLAMVGDMAKRLSLANPLLDNPLEGQAIVMIDEIELHLHPSWQRKIIQNLERTFPNCQFIITTHSPQILSELDAQDKVILLKDNKAHTLPLSYGRDSNWILDVLMDVPSRPIEIKQKLDDYFDLIDKGELEQATELREALEIAIGTDEPDFIKADLLIRRKKRMSK